MQIMIYLMQWLLPSLSFPVVIQLLNAVSQLLLPVLLNKEVLLLFQLRFCNCKSEGNNVGGILHYNRL